MNVSFLPEKAAEPLTVSQNFSAVAVHSAVSDEKAVAVLLETAENEEQKRRVVQTILRLLLMAWCFAMPIYLWEFDVINPHLRSAFMGFSVGGPQLIRYFALSQTKRQQNAVVALLQFPHRPALFAAAA